MATPHIGAEKGDVAERILLPGDPLRAKFIAENFLENPKLYTSVRNILGYTGTYKGVPVSVQGTGMGIPSISIYVHELIHEFGCKKLIRVGTCGGMHPDVKIRDVLIAEGATTDSSTLRSIFGPVINYAPIADFDLLETAVNKARAKGCNFKVGKIFSSDFFYNPKAGEINEKLRDYGHLAIEMESAGLYWEAAVNRKRALTILSISDHLFKKQALTSEQIRDSFTDMMEIALDTAWEFAE